MSDTSQPAACANGRALSHFAILIVMTMLLLPGCATYAIRNNCVMGPESKFYPATSLDGELAANAIGNCSGSPNTLLLCLGMTLFDTPFSLASDTICLPWDVYRVFVPSEKQKKLDKQAQRDKCTANMANIYFAIKSCMKSEPSLVTNWNTSFDIPLKYIENPKRNPQTILCPYERSNMPYRVNIATTNATLPWADSVFCPHGPKGDGTHPDHTL